MSILSNIRLPFRDDKLFSTLAFAVFILPLAFWVFNNENFETIKFILFLFFTGCALMVFIFDFFKPGEHLNYNRPLPWLLVLFCALAFLSTLHSLDWVYSVFGFYYRFTNGLLFYLALAVFLFLLVHSLSKDRLSFLLKVLVFDALVISVLAFFQSLGIFYYAGLEPSGFIRPPGLLGNPDFSAMFVACVLPFAAAFFVQSKSFKARVYYGVVIFSIIIANLLFSSRGALLALGLGGLLCLLLLWLGGFGKKIFLGIFFALALSVLVSPVILSQSRPSAWVSIIKGADVNTTSRLIVWKSALAAIKNQPFLGYGPGTFAVYFEHHRPASEGAGVGVFDDAHNLFLQMAATTGMPFTLVFLGLIALAFYYGFVRIRKEKDIVSLASLISLFVWVVIACFNPVTIACFMLLAVVLAGLISLRVKTIEFRIKAVPAAIFGILSACFVIFSLCLGVSEQLFYFAESAYLNQDPKTAYHLTAVAKEINPTSQLYYIYYAGAEIGLKLPPEKIVKDIEYMKSLHPEHTRSTVEASNLYGLLFQSTQNKDYLKAAAENLKQALAIDSYDPDRYGQLALYEFALGDIPQSKADTLKSLSLKNDNFFTWVLLAKIYQSENNRAQVTDALTQAFKLSPDVPQLRYLLQLAKNLRDVRQVPLDTAVRIPPLN